MLAPVPDKSSSPRIRAMRPLAYAVAVLLLLAAPAWGQTSVPGATICTGPCMMPSSEFLPAACSARNNWCGGAFPLAQCDVDELRAASRAWAKLSFPGTRDPDANLWPMMTPSLYRPCALEETPYCLRIRADELERAAQVQRDRFNAEQRWRRAVAACGP